MQHRSPNRKLAADGKKRPSALQCGADSLAVCPQVRKAQRGVTTVQLLVILVPVLFGFIGFAVDLGQLYLIRGELKVAANAMALSAAQKLIGTDQGITDATTAAQLA